MPLLYLTFVSHATVLIEMDGVRVLTDPVLRNRAGLLRRHGPGIPPSLYGAVDAVVISHLHADHFDLPSLRMLGHDTPLFVPPGARDDLTREGFRQVQEMEPGAEARLGAVRLTATRAVHEVRRLPFKPGTDCLGFMVRGSRQVYFAGDTDIFPEMASLGDDLDVALLPVWGWGPRLGKGHMNPQRAAEALQLLRPRVAVPIHWGSLCPLGLGGRIRPRYLVHPPHTFALHARRLAPQVNVQVLAPGQRMCLYS